MTADNPVNVRYRLVAGMGLIALFLSVSSCNTFQNAWTDFNAYFNTFYNAQSYYEDGLRQVENRDIEYNPERPIRIHPTPTLAGESDFEEAILKAADIIHSHEDSRWVDNSVELMGKAYFYQQEYFSAAQNFDEIYNNAIDPERRQNAVLWRGRVFLEMEEYGPGVSYLVNHLNSGEFEWEEEIRAEIQAVLGQIYTYNENWTEAEYYLSEAVGELSERRFNYRAWFLLGQVRERLERWEDALYAFEQAMERRNEEFDLRYHAYMKKGQMLRETGRYQQAYDHFDSMAREDVFYEFLGDIEYQKARTLHMAGDIDEALDMYKLTLRQEINPPSNYASSLIYYNIANIHREETLDYNLAAAYYDSAQTTQPSEEQMPEWYDAGLMAESFGDYSELDSRVDHLDSLLWLGSLEEAEFDSVIQDIRDQKIREMEEEMEQQTASDVVIHEDDIEETDDVDVDDDNGFLNHLNRERLNRASQQFTAYWGNRPLVDDWRRGEAVRRAVRNRETEEEIDEDQVAVNPEEMQDLNPAQQVEVDISEVPFTEEERQQTLKDLASASYEVGNVFFLSLNMPDSAAANYKRVIENYPDSELVSQALYSLTEVYMAMDDSSSARTYAERLVEEHSTTIYAERIAERYGLALPGEAFTEAAEDTTEAAWAELQRQVEEEFTEEHTDELKQFAQNYPESERAPLALYHASMAYISKAKEDTSYAEKLTRRNEKKEEWEEEQRYITSMKDSANTVLEQDTTLTEEEQTYWSEWADTTVSEPDLSEYNPYENAYWDSARVVVDWLQREYQGFGGYEKMAMIQDEIGTPPQPEPEEEAGEPEAAEHEEELSEYNYPDCSEMDSDPEVLGGLQNFYERSRFQETIDQLMLSGEFEVTFVADEEGQVIDVIYGEEDDPLGFMEELSEAMLEHMQIEPPQVDGESTGVICTIPMEFSHN